MHVTTDRLTLRPFQAEDGPALHAYLSDPEVVKFEPYPPLDLQTCQKEAARRAEDRNFVAVCIKDSGELIGNLYLAEQDPQCFELGYVFSRVHWGKGYAGEAARAAISHLFANGAHRVLAHCNPDNSPSWKLLERLGFRREGHLRQNVAFNKDASGNPIWQDTYCYGLLQSDFIQ